jgi:hypothetical protein
MPRLEQSFATSWHQSKPQRHQSNHNTQMPIVRTFTHRLGTIGEQICISCPTPVAQGSHLWCGSAIIVCITKHKRANDGGRSVCSTFHT